MSVGIVLAISVKKSNLISTLMSGLILSPLLLERNDIRPEVFGYLFFSLIVYMLITYPNNKKLMYFLPLIMLVWINIHITFVFGIFLILLLLIKTLFSKEKYPYIFILIFSLFILIINPHGLKGVMYPFNIFQNYGYTIVENQNTFYLSKMIFDPLLKYLFLISPVVIISLIILTIVNQLTAALILLTFFCLTIFQFRHLPFFVLAAIPAFSISFDKIMRLILQKYPVMVSLKQLAIGILLLTLFLMSAFFISNKYYLIFDTDKQFGLGFRSVQEKAVEFVYENKLSGNIFNNFDIGGYFIYKFHPKYKVFIDNRPEAYPVDFINDVYKKLQVDQLVQDKVFEQYKIKTVFFNYNDQTEWGKAFVARILKDHNWRLIYLDPEVFIATIDDNFTDIRENKKIFRELINTENNYLNLLNLSKFFYFLEDRQLEGEAFAKAEDINPSSCAIKRVEFDLYRRNSQFYLYKARDLEKNSWYCF